MLTKGITADGQTVRLPEPTLADGLDAAAQRDAIAAVADRNHPLEALLRKSVVAPLLLKMADGNAEAGAADSTHDDAAPRDGLKRVDLWFIAYGKIETLGDESFWKAWHQQGSTTGAKSDNPRDLQSARSAMLTADELKARGIHDATDERHLSADVTLFNELRLSATQQAMQTRTAESIILAGAIDPRFAADKDYPNRWWRLDRDDAGQLKSGPSHDYSAAGWYVKATKLHEPEGAMLVEYHLVFEEPTGWFNGGNYLRSKLPVIAQDGVRRFRRHLTGAEQGEK